MKYTENYNLKKPEATDAYNIEDFNENMEKIDTELKNFSDMMKVEDISDSFILSSDDNVTIESISVKKYGNIISGCISVESGVWQEIGEAQIIVVEDKYIPLHNVTCVAELNNSRFEFLENKICFCDGFDGSYYPATLTFSFCYICA